MKKPHDMMGGFAKGLAVIEAFGAVQPELTIADVARATGLDRATARRCLLTLVEHGFASVNGKQFALTPRVLRLGYSYLASQPLPRLVQPFIEQLAASTNESCSVSVLDGNEIVYVARASQRRVMSIGLGVGSRLPAFCASMGRVLLAALPETKARALLTRSKRTRFTDYTRIGVPELMRELSGVRTRGYSIVDQELELGLRSIAIPLRGRSGVVAALNVGAQVARLSVDEMKDRVLPAMLIVSAELHAHL